MIVSNKRSETIIDVPLREWGHLENWKSTASFHGSQISESRSAVSFANQ
ncbi:MAG: hypothetical protein K2G62_03575 [Oscillospiraceae bacterium]|nr:hypothetical protein [Oscillospiraceae bacterium]